MSASTPLVTPGTILDGAEIDVTDHGLRGSIGSGPRPNGMALSGGFLYWVNLGSGTSGAKDGDVRRVRVR